MRLRAGGVQGKTALSMFVFLLYYCFFPADASGSPELFESEEWTACRGIIILTLGSLAMNLFLLFRFIMQARRSGQELARRINERKEESVLQYIEDLRHELKREKEKSGERIREMEAQLAELRRKLSGDSGSE